MKTKTYAAVRCENYNGHEALFMMKPDDFRLTDERFASNYTVLSGGSYDRRKATLTTPKGSFKVAPDWSLRQIA